MAKESISTTAVLRAPGGPDSIQITPVFHSMGVIEITGDYNFHLHAHTEYEVILVDKGRYVCQVNGQKIILNPEEVLVVKPGDHHQDFCRPPLTYFGIKFILENSWSTEEEKPCLFTRPCPPSCQQAKLDRQLYHPLLQKIQQESTLSDFISSHVQDALILEFFWYLVRSLPRKGISEWFFNWSSEQSFTIQLRRYLQANINQNLDVSQMAKFMRMSESSLAHKCKNITGESPAKLFRKYKMKQALNMLENSSMKIKEIGKYLGFDNQYYFSRAFKNHFHKSPSSCR